MDPLVKTDTYREQKQLNIKSLKQKEEDRLSSIYLNEILLEQEQRYEMETDLITSVETGTSRFEEPTKVLFSNEEKQENKKTYIF